MAEVGSLFIRLRADATEFEKAMESVGDKIKGAGKSMQSTGGTLSKYVTAPLAGVAAAAVKVGTDYEYQMARVQAISGATGEEFDALRATARELGASTMFSATEAAQGMEFLALAGWEVSAVVDAMPGLLSLAASQQMGLAEASAVVADNVNAFGLAASDAMSVADQMAATASRSSTDVGQLGEALKMAAPSAASMGMSLAETNAAIGMLADVGIKGSQGGTALAAVLADMNAKAKDGRLEFGEFSVAVYDAAGNFRPFGDILRDIEQGTADLTQEQRANALGMVFARQSMRALDALLASGADRYDELSDAIRNSNGFAAEQAAIMGDTLRGGFDELSSAMEEVLLQLAEELGPIIKDTIIPALQDFIGRISEAVAWFGNLDEGTRRTILMIAGIAAALGPVLVVFGTMAIAIGGAISAFGSIAAVVGSAIGVIAKLGGVIALLANPIGLVIAAIGLLVGAFILAYTRSETFRDIVNAVWERVQRVISAAVEVIAAVVGAAFGVVRSVAETAFGAVRDLTEAVWPTVRQIISTTAQIIGRVIEIAGKIVTAQFQAIRAVAEFVWPLIQTVIAAVLGAIRAVIEAVLGVIRTAWEATGEHLLSFARKVWETIKTVISSTLGIIAGVLETIMGIISLDWDRAWSGIRQIGESIWAAITGVIELAIETIKTIVQGGLALLEAFFGDTWDTITGVVSDAIGEVVQFMRGLPGDILNALGDLGRLLWDAGRDLIQGLIDGIRNKWGEVKGLLTGLTDLLPDWKGPARRDRLLLEPSGRLIMEGLGAGLEAGEADIERRLVALTQRLGNLTVDATLSGAPAGAAAGGWPSQVIIPVQLGDGPVETIILDVLSRQMRRVSGV